MPRYRLDKLEMPDLVAMPKKMRAKIMRQGTRVVALRARELAPVRTGRLKKSIGYNVSRGGLQGKVRSKAPHSWLVHDGTRPHTIPAPKDPDKRKRAFPLFAGGHAERHPGARKQPFLTDAGEQSRPEVEARMAEVAREVIRKEVGS